MREDGEVRKGYLAPPTKGDRRPYTVHVGGRFTFFSPVPRVATKPLKSGILSELNGYAGVIN